MISGFSLDMKGLEVAGFIGPSGSANALAVVQNRGGCGAWPGDVACIGARNGACGAGETPTYAY